MSRNAVAALLIAGPWLFGPLLLEVAHRWRNRH